MTDPAQRLSVKEKIAYGLGDTASNFYFQFFNLFLVYYYTDIVGLPAGTVGTMMLAVRVFDAVLDPTVGLIADRTRTRFGTFRPYILWGALPYGVLGYLMFLNPAFSPTGKLAYAYATYGLMWVAYTFINIPYSSLMGVMSPSSEQRTSLSTYRFVCAFGATMAIGAGVVPLKRILGGGSETEGIRRTMLGFAIISVLMFLFTFAQTKERVRPSVDQRGGLRQDLANLGRNRPWIILFFAAFFILTSVAVRNGSIVYYFKYTVGNEALLSRYNFLGFAAFIAGALLTKPVLRLAERRTLVTGLYALNALLLGTFFLVNPQSTVLLVGLNMLANLVAGPTPAILWSMYADVADFGEWKFGRRSTGLIFSGSVFSQKMGLALGTGVVGWLLAGFGFVANAPQSSHSNLGIRLMFSLLPAVLGLIGALFILAYPITDPFMKQIEQDLAERKTLLPSAHALPAISR